MFGLIKKLFGTQQTRLLNKYQKLVQLIKKEEEKLLGLSDHELKNKTQEFRSRIAKGEPLEKILPEAYAVVKVACRRLCGTEIQVSGYHQKWDMIPYDVQLLGAICLHYGTIAEMQTGEGKTLTASMPLYLNALTGKPVHLVTVNDYLAQRDCEWIGSIFRWLGLRVEALTNQTPPQERKSIYEADILYGTASEFGFDYLRDNSMAQNQEEQCQRGFYFVIIDEVDSILIDQARTPLIISGPATSSRQMYDQLRDPVAQLVLFQKELCNKFSNDTRKVLEKLNRLEGQQPRTLTKAEENEEKEAYKILWLVSKGMPRNKVLKRIKEDPQLRGEIDKWDIYYYSEVNKEEKSLLLSQLYMIVDERTNEYELTDKGIQLWGEMGGSVDDFIMLDLGFEYACLDQTESLNEGDLLQKKIELQEQDAIRKERAHNLRQMLRAHLLMEKDVDYIISDGKIVIIDENTGRPQPDRRFSDGLHQAIEAKESVAIQGETQTYATVTLQNYFRLYPKISGMTGTALPEAQEFKEIYNLLVLAIPPHRPSRRRDFDDKIYMTEREKYGAILAEIQAIHATHRPILIGTDSVESSQKLSRILKQNHLPHTVLNAKSHAQEAEIIAKAGQLDAITVATNMAGRGTDIKLGPGVAEIGGLHLIGSVRDKSRRIDLQLRGRCGRQGDPGSSQFYACFEDSLLSLFTSPRVLAFLKRFRPEEGESISAKPINASIQTAQKRVEQRDYQMRKHTLEYDDVMNKQRSQIYGFRNEVLRTPNPLKIVEEILEVLCLKACEKFCMNNKLESGRDSEGFRQWLMLHFPLTVEKHEFEKNYMQIEDIENQAIDKVLAAFKYKIQLEQKALFRIYETLPIENQQMHPDEVLKEVMRNLLIRSIDKLWQEYLLHIDHLRTEVYLRAVGQKDPLLEFKQEAFVLFETFSYQLKAEIANAVFKFRMALPEDQVDQSKPETLVSKKNKRNSIEFKTSLSSLSELDLSENRH